MRRRIGRFEYNLKSVVKEADILPMTNDLTNKRQDVTLLMTRCVLGFGCHVQVYMALPGGI